MIYLDNAATSWPKPPIVLKAMTNVLKRAGGNPGRSGHRLSTEASKLIDRTREDVAEFLGAHDSSSVIFTYNATHAINIVLQGFLKPGDNVVTSSMEHNAVMRPLRALEKQGLNLHIVPCASDGSLNVNDINKKIDVNTRLVVINHASNVTGTILPVYEVASIAHRAGALLLVDATQTAGKIPINVQEMGINLLAFTGHKGLLGPPGIGGLIIGDHVDVSKIKPLIYGGTGSYLELEEQPDLIPDRFESGTPNLAGIAGLQAGIRWILDRGLEEIRSKEEEILDILYKGLTDVRNVNLYGPLDPKKSVAVLSFTVTDKKVSEFGKMLDERFGILTRTGLQCAPMAHKTIGTFPEGTIRLSPGIFTKLSEVRATIKAVGNAATHAMN